MKKILCVCLLMSVAICSYAQFHRDLTEREWTIDVYPDDHPVAYLENSDVSFLKDNKLRISKGAKIYNGNYIVSSNKLKLYFNNDSLILNWRETTGLGEKVFSTTTNGKVAIVGFKYAGVYDLITDGSVCEENDGFYSVKIPKGWKIDDIKKDGDIKGDRYANQPEEELFFIQVADSVLSYDKIVDYHFSSTPFVGMFTVESSGDFQCANASGKLFIASDGVETSVKVYAFILNNKTYIISYVDIYSSHYSTQKSVFDEVVRTFHIKK